MVIFYATFSGPTAFRNHYVEVKIENKNALNVPASMLARQCLFDHFGGAYHTMHDEAYFVSHFEDIDLEKLCTIKVSGNEYSIL